MTTLDAFLDDTPGGQRGLILRDGEPHHLIIHLDADDPAERLGARLAGRVVSREPSLRGAFVDIGAARPAFLPLKTDDRTAQGAAVEVRVVTEPRDDKGARLGLIGPGEGAPRLLQPGPTVPETLSALAPGVEIVTGLEALRAVRDAEGEALAGAVRTSRLDVLVERTRALIAVDIDLPPAQGVSGGAKARDRANAEGLRQAARLIRLNGWGGTVAVDLAGVGQDQTRILQQARAAFAGDEASFGPLSRFGLLQLALPWRRRPLADILEAAGDVGRLAGALNEGLLADTRRARVTARCAPDLAERAAGSVARLGPRAHLSPDPALPAGVFRIEEH